MHTSIEIVPIPALTDNYIWTLIDKNNKTALIVDPGEASPVEDYLNRNNLSLLGILVTHHHWDHTNGIVALKKNNHVPVYTSFLENFSDIESVQNGDRINVPNFPINFQVIAIPGHTLKHIAFYSSGIVFTGDTLFAGGCGRLFEGTPEQMVTSLAKLANLPEDTKIYCGHEYTLKNLQFANLVEPGNKKIPDRLAHVTKLRQQHLPSLPATLREEKETNPFLRYHSSPEIKANVENYAKRKLTDRTEIFAWLRKWKDGF